MREGDVVAGRYTLIKRLGRGGMSEVFLAEDQSLERQVAIKLLAGYLDQEESFVKRFKTEARAAARLQHPHIIKLFDYGFDDEEELHYMVMEYLAGENGEQLINKEAPLAWERARRILIELIDALAYAHSRGVIHRDVKPANLLFDLDGALKLADFGIAKIAEGVGVTKTGIIVGTASYLAPEQINGQSPSPASDIYAFGVCAYRFMSAELPYSTQILPELALAQSQAEFRPLAQLAPQIPIAVSGIIERCLDPDPTARPGLSELKAALEKPETVEIAKLINKADSQNRSKLWPVATLLALALGFGSGYYLGKPEPKSDQVFIEIKNSHYKHQIQDIKELIRENIKK